MRIQLLRSLILILPLAAVACGSGDSGGKKGSPVPGPNGTRTRSSQTIDKIEDLIAKVAPGFVNTGSIDGLKDRLEKIEKASIQLDTMRNPIAWRGDYDRKAPTDETVAVGSTCQPFSTLFTFYNGIFLVEKYSIGESGKTMMNDTVTPRKELPSYAATIYTVSGGGDDRTIHIGTNGAKTLWASEKITQHFDTDSISQCVYLIDDDAETTKGQCIELTEEGARIDTSFTDTYKTGSFTNDHKYQIKTDDIERSFTTSARQTGPLTASYTADYTSFFSQKEVGLGSVFLTTFRKADVELEFTQPEEGVTGCTIAKVNAVE